MATSTGSNEMFSTVKGRKVDARLHEPILAGIHPAEDLAHRQQSYASAVQRHGIAPAVAAKMYGLKP